MGKVDRVEFRVVGLRSSQWEAVWEIKKKTGKSINAIIREAVDLYLKKEVKKHG